MTGDLSPVYAHLKNPTMVDYPGHLSALFFLTGCNFTCGFCHNSQLAVRQDVRLSWSELSSLCEGFKKQWVDAAVISGGEPTLDEDLPELIRFLRHFGWHIKLDTNGSRPEILKDVVPLVDYVAMDIKCSAARYPKFAGFSATSRMLESIEIIREKAADYEFRTTVIESVHDDEEMLAIAGLLQGAKRYVLQPFIPRDDLPDPELSTQPRTSSDRLEQIKELMAGKADEVLISTQR